MSSQQLYVEVAGRRVPSLGFGTYKLRGEICRSQLSAALELGYRSIDTAQAYGNERVIGEVLAASGIPRDEIFLTTKVWPDDLVADPAVIDASLERLRVARVDLLLIHWPSTVHEMSRYLELLLGAQLDGKTALIGVSNFPPRMLAQALRVAPIVCDQVEYHPYLEQRGLLQLAREQQLLLTAYSPLAEGRVAHDELLRSIAARKGKTPAQVALRWLLQQPWVNTIPRTADRRRLAENFDVFDFELDATEMVQVGSLQRANLRLTDPAWAPDWSAGIAP